MRTRDLWWLAGVTMAVSYGTDAPWWAWLLIVPVGVALMIALIGMAWNHTFGPLDGPPYN